MHIELKYYNPKTGYIGHFFFPDHEIKTARNYFDDAVNCGNIILIWRLVPTTRIVVK